jgi:hypothetical protein
VKDPVEQCYEWQRGNIRSVRSCTKDLKEELHNTAQTFIWRKQQESNVREMTKIVKGRPNDKDKNGAESFLRS